MKSALGDAARVGHILEAIGFIELFLIDKSAESLEENAMLRFALERQFEIIGEASSHISIQLKETYKDLVPWTKIKSFRNIVAHEYFAVESDLVWSILTSEITPLKVALMRIQDEQKFMK